MGEAPYKTVTVHDLKTRLCRYLADLQNGTYRGLVVRRYTREVVFIAPLKTDVERAAERASLDLRRWEAAQTRTAHARRHWRAHLLSWPLAKYYPGHVGRH